MPHRSEIAGRQRQPVRIPGSARRDWTSRSIFQGEQPWVIGQRSVVSRRGGPDRIRQGNAQSEHVTGWLSEDIDRVVHANRPPWLAAIDERDLAATDPSQDRECGGSVEHRPIERLERWHRELILRVELTAVPGTESGSRTIVCKKRNCETFEWYSRAQHRPCKSFILAR